MNGVTREKSEARGLRELAEKRFRDFNLKSTLKFAKRAHHLNPNLDGATKSSPPFRFFKLSLTL
ncbi:E3 ubiquitin-protein ligase BRE1A [Cucumis melo var. makuwa]|nr:E3 ubiquitin-protein ligase BRE1A [Cucumis melo var. makuwa]